MAERRWDGRSLGPVWGWRFLFWWLRRVGLRPTYPWLALVAAWYALWAPRDRRRASDRFLAAALGPTHAPGRAWRRARHFYAFAVAQVDRIALPVLGPGAFRFQPIGWEALRETVRATPGLVLVGSHWGSWEMASTQEGVVQHLVMLEQERAALAAFSNRANLELPHVIAINQGDFAAIEVLRALRAGEGVALKADRVVDEHVVMVPFFGRPTAFPAGPHLVAAMARAPLVYSDCRRLPGGGYELFAAPARTLRLQRGAERMAQIEASVRAYAAQLEARVRLDPYQWFNFFDLWPEERPSQERPSQEG